MWHSSMLSLELIKQQRKELTKDLPKNYDKSRQQIEGLKVYGQPYNPTYHSQGVTVFFPRIKKLKGQEESYTTYRALIHVNFSKLLQDNEHLDLVTYKSDVNFVLQHLNEILMELFGSLVWEQKNKEASSCNTYIQKTPFKGLSDPRLSVNRLDCTTQLYGISQDDIDAYIRCLNKGDWSTYKLQGDRVKYSGSVYATTLSLNINIYDKRNQMISKNQYLKERGMKPNFDAEAISKAKGILRIEVQCKRRKILEICNKYHVKATLPDLLNPQISRAVITENLSRIGGRCDYYAIDVVDTAIEKSPLQRRTKDKLLDIVNTINRNTNMKLSDVKSNLLNGKKTNKSTVYGYIDKIEHLTIQGKEGCNAVPLPKNSVRKLKNLLVRVEESWDKIDDEIPF